MALRKSANRRPSELVDQSAVFAWFEWLERRGYQPTSVWDNTIVDSGDRFSWIPPGGIRCADGPVRYVEFRSMRREGWKGVLNEVRVHLEASWALGRVPGLHSLEIVGPQLSFEYDEEGGEAEWMGNDLGLGLIERLNTGDSIGDLWDSPTINARPLDWEQEHASSHAVTACAVVLTWTRTTSWPVLNWSALPVESYDALNRLLGLRLSEQEWLPNRQGAASDIRSVHTPLGAYVRWASWSLLPVGMLTGGIALATWRWFTFWPSVSGIVLSLAGAIALMFSAERLLVYLHGMKRLVGILERKWLVNNDEYVESFHVWVDGLPFEVSQKVYDWLSVGDRVAVAFKPRDKSVVSLRKMGQPGIDPMSY